VNISLANVFRIPELRNRILFTLGLLSVYRLGIFVSTPGVDRAVMAQLTEQAGLLGLFNLFSGGALEQMSVFALGIMPYISASIIMQLMAVVYPPLERLQKEGEPGRRKINQYTRYGTVVLSVVQGFFIAVWLESLNAETPGLVTTGGPWFYFVTVVALTTGTAFLMWLGEQITERGIGNGISLIIFAGIVAGLPGATLSTLNQASRGDIPPVSFVMLVLLVVSIVFGIVYCEKAQRRIPVQYSRRSGSGRLASAVDQSSYLPLKLNQAGVIPPIFASALLMFPTSMASYFPNSSISLTVMQVLNPLAWQYNVVYVVLIIFFTYFYTAVTFNTADVADNMRRQGSVIPGVRPGKMTSQHIDYVLTRLLAFGSVYLAGVCVVPVVMMGYFPVSFYYGGTGLLIVVSVGLDTVQQIEGQLLTRGYEMTGGSRRGGRLRDRVEEPQEV
jgi:preprotein translocase subunit SecY